MNKYYIIHKNSKEEIYDFPAYGKHFNSQYGYLILTIDLRVIFVSSNHIDGVQFEDVTNDYHIMEIIN